MAYMPRDMAVIAYVRGHTQWFYKTSDTWTDCLEPEYFDMAVDLVADHDSVIVDCPSGVWMGWFAKTPSGVKLMKMGE